ncbi:MAG: response regulator [Chloroflexi bacterium]|nr:response regulator [Chloroflexota bacterium]
MPRKEDLQRLLMPKNRRLQKLKEQQAAAGWSTDPNILLEIEDLEDEVMELQTAIAALEGKTAVEESQSAPAKLKAGPWQVLVVDDEPSWQNRLKRILRGINCTVVTTSNYMEAEAELTNSTPDLVTIDLNLDTSSDYADGLELVSQIREKFGPSFPVIIVSGQGDLGRQRRAFRKYHVFDFIEKAKFDFEEFKETVIEAINATHLSSTNR